jgi:hypothetical protein
VIHSFAYRHPRLPATFSVEFLTEDKSFAGVTHDLSEQGISVRFSQLVLQGTAGKVRFRVGHCLLELDARVTHSEGLIAGLVFSFASLQERRFLEALMQALTQALQHSRDNDGHTVQGR